MIADLDDHVAGIQTSESLDCHKQVFVAALDGCRPILVELQRHEEVCKDDQGRVEDYDPGKPRINVSISPTRLPSRQYEEHIMCPRVHYRLTKI